MNALENGSRRNARIALEGHAQARVRDTRERLIAWFSRAALEDARLTGRVSSWSIAAAALKDEVVPPADAERVAWFTASLSAACGTAGDRFTGRLLVRLVEDLAVGLAHAGPFSEWGDLAERLGELVADALAGCGT